MLRIALKSAVFNKRRLIGSGLSVVIGIAFLAGTLVFTDTIKRTFDTLFSDVYESTDAYVRSSNGVDAGFGQTIYDRIPETLVAKTQQVNGVDEAFGYVIGYARIIGRNGKPVGIPNGPPNYGSSLIDSSLTPWKVKSPGRFPKGPTEAVIDSGSAKAGKLKVGSKFTVVSQGGARTFTLVGTARFGAADSPGGATFAMFDLPTSQSFIGKPGAIDAMFVRAKAGVSQRQLADQLQVALGGSVKALTGAAQTKESQSAVAQSLKFINILLLVFAAIALFVGSFIIYNTFSIIVAQRQRENALLRAIGASRSQIISSGIVESFLVGLFASSLGFIGGIAMSSVLKAFLSAFGIDIPAGGTVLRPRTAVVSFAVGVTMTMFAAVFPSIRASRVAPVAAMRDVAIDRSATSKARLASGVVVSLIGALMVGAGLAGRGATWLAGGVPLLFIGLFVLGPLIARPVAGVIGSPLPALVGTTGVLARRNSMRNPKRTARTASALMVGVALVAGITVLAASITSSIRSIVGDSFVGDFVVNSRTQGIGGLPPSLASELSALPEIDSATGIQVGFGRINGKTSTFSVADPQFVDRMFDLQFVQGKGSDLTDSGILLSKARAERDGLVVGSPITIAMVDGVSRTLRVQGIFKKTDFFGSYLVSNSLYAKGGADLFHLAVFATKARGVRDGTAQAAMADVVKKFPTGKLLSRRAYIDEQASRINQFVNLIYGLLALAILIAVFGIANTLSLSVFERTRELGLLRAVGAYRSQIRSSVRWEAVITALLGAVQGIVVGVLLGYAIIVALHDQGLRRFTLPIVPLIVLVLLAIVAGVVAAIRPGRRAARLDILRAIATN